MEDIRDDVVALEAWLSEHARDIGIDLGRVVISGSSAGMPPWFHIRSLSLSTYHDWRILRYWCFSCRLLRVGPCMYDVESYSTSSVFQSLGIIKHE